MARVSPSRMNQRKIGFEAILPRQPVFSSPRTQGRASSPSLDRQNSAREAAGPQPKQQRSTVMEEEDIL